MEGEPIAILNRTMTETIDILIDEAKKNADAELRISVLEFNSKCRWLQPKGSEKIEDFKIAWQDLKAVGGTYMGAALAELNNKLSQKSFLGDLGGSYMPILIFMTDGYPNDEYKKSLELIRQNKWFKNATKIGFAVGVDADKDVVAEIVGRVFQILCKLQK